MIVRGLIKAEANKSISEQSFTPPSIGESGISIMADDITSETSAGGAQSDTAATSEKEPVTFLSLPAELRNDIYNLALNPADGSPNTATLQTLPYWDPRTDRQPALLQTCQQIRAEAKPIWLNDTAFIAYFATKRSNGLAPVQHVNQRLKKWLELLGPDSASKIKNLQLKFEQVDLTTAYKVSLLHLHDSGSERYHTKSVKVDQRDAVQVKIYQNFFDALAEWSGMCDRDLELDFGSRDTPCVYKENVRIPKEAIMAIYDLDGLGLNMDVVSLWSLVPEQDDDTV